MKYNVANGSCSLQLQFLSSVVAVVVAVVYVAVVVAVVVIALWASKKGQNILNESCL